jgi:hypothetical protein
MDIINVVDNLSTEMYQRFLCAAETGKWPEGTPVAKEQQETALQIVMAYQSRILRSTEIMTVGENGEIVQKSKREIKAEFKNSSSEQQAKTADTNTIARFSNI